MVEARPRLRVLGHPIPFEAAIGTVLGQQVSVAAARTFAGRPGGGVREERTRRPDDVSRPGGAARCGPRGASRCASASRVPDPGRVQAVAAAFAERGTRLRSAGANSSALPGIGPWTADYLAVTSGDRDAFTPGDLVLAGRSAGSHAQPLRPEQSDGGPSAPTPCLTSGLRVPTFGQPEISLFRGVSTVKVLRARRYRGYLSPDFISCARGDPHHMSRSVKRIALAIGRRTHLRSTVRPVSTRRLRHRVAAPAVTKSLLQADRRLLLQQRRSGRRPERVRGRAGRRQGQEGPGGAPGGQADHRLPPGREATGQARGTGDDQEHQPAERAPRPPASRPSPTPSC